jgi:hypothetical protein
LTLLLLLASLSFGQSTSTVIPLEDALRISNLRNDVEELKKGRPRLTGKPTFAGGFCFADGTCQTTAPSASSSQVIFSSVSADGIASAASAAFGVCQASAPAITITSSTPIWVGYAGILLNTVSGAHASWNILMNGGYVSAAGYSGTKGVTGNISRNGGDCFNASATAYVGILSAGTYNFCITLGAQNTGVTKNSACNGGLDANVANSFFVTGKP